MEWAPDSLVAEAKRNAANGTQDHHDRQALPRHGLILGWGEGGGGTIITLLHSLGQPKQQQQDKHHPETGRNRS